MALGAQQNTTTMTATGAERNYRGPLAMVTTLFFIWGSLTSLNDVLIPFAQHVFNLQIAASMLIQTAFFSAYFVFSIPSAKLIDWIGYQKAIVVRVGDHGGCVSRLLPCRQDAIVPVLPRCLGGFGYRHNGPSGRRESVRGDTRKTADGFESLEFDSSFQFARNYSVPMGRRPSDSQGYCRTQLRRAPRWKLRP